MTRPRSRAVSGGDAFRVTAMTRSGGGLRLTIAVRGAPDIAVDVSPRDGKPAWGETKHLSIRYEGSEGGALEPAHEEALKLIAAGLRDVSFDAIARNVPETAAAPAATRAAIAPGDDDRSHEVVTVDEWGNSDRWRTFIFRREFARNVGSAVRLAGRRVLTVSHGESECRYATPQIDGRTMSLYNYPWVRPLEIFTRPDKGGGEGVPDDIPWYISTDLRDADIITGGTAKLDAALAYLAERTGPADIVVVKSTCVPHVIGDDMEGSVARWGGRGRIRYDDVFAPQEGDLTAELFAAAIAGGKRRRRRERRAVNVAGLAPDLAYAELDRLLKDAGVFVNCALIPEIDLDEAVRWRDASIQILVPNPYFRALYEKVLVPLPLTTIAAAAPYGPAATGQWLDKIARATGRTAAFRRVWRARQQALSPSFDRLRRGAASARLGFVIAPDDYAALCDPMQSAGIPVLDVVSELGFGIDLLVYAAPGAATPVLPLTPAHAPAAAVHHFSDPASLKALMQSSPCTAIYSDLYGDTRITEAGKTPFSLQFFEPGLEGALRTAERLLGACENIFYRSYGRHARPT